MKRHIISTLMIASSATVLGNTYDEAKNTIATAPAEIKSIMAQAPKTFEFESLLKPNTSSVSYTGQVFRQILMKDIKSAMGKIKNSSRLYKKPEDVLKMLNSYFAYNENTSAQATGVIYGEAMFKVKTKDFSGNNIEVDEGFFYSDIQSPGKNLKGKIAGVDNPLRRGKLYGVNSETPEAYINSLFTEFAENAVNRKSFNVPNGNLAPQTVKMAQVTADGRDLTQLVQKFLYVSVSFSQAARDYLSTDLGPKKGLNADNTKPSKQGKPYTALEHHFDEGFGYYGAARDYALYTDAQIKSGGSIDTDENEYISLKSEKNYGISVNAAKIDLAAAEGNVDFTNEINNAFLVGRHLIVKQPKNYKKYVVANAQVALGAWEKTLAATVIHYINRTINEMNEYGTEDYLYKDFVKYWSEMKGYALAAQFSPTSILSDTDFDKVHQLMRQAPELPHSGQAASRAYQRDLLKARDILKAAYNFSEENTVNW